MNDLQITIEDDARIRHLLAGYYSLSRCSTVPGTEQSGTNLKRIFGPQTNYARSWRRSPAWSLTPTPYQPQTQVPTA